MQAWINSKKKSMAIALSCFALPRVRSVENQQEAKELGESTAPYQEEQGSVILDRNYRHRNKKVETTTPNHCPINAFNH